MECVPLFSKSATAFKRDEAAESMHQRFVKGRRWCSQLSFIFNNSRSIALQPKEVGRRQEYTPPSVNGKEKMLEFEHLHTIHTMGNFLACTCSV